MKVLVGVVAVIYAAIVIWLMSLDVLGGLIIGVVLGFFVWPWVAMFYYGKKWYDESARFNGRK